MPGGTESAKPPTETSQTIEYHPIGVIRTPFAEPHGMPIQPSGGAGVKGHVEVFPEYREGLQDLEGFSHIILLYHLHLSSGFKLLVVPYMDTELRGVFATRAPRRPNPIGLSVVRLTGVEHGVLNVENLDIVDGTPLLDIKPYVPDFDVSERLRTGWLEEVRKTVGDRRSDARFHT
jgi:tRNA-Thr(GGU) m(6)t(6)A37 methyltransferase TsaA